MYPLVEDMSEIYARPLPRVYAIFLFAIEYSAKAQHTTTGACAPGVAPPPSRARMGAWVKNGFGNLVPEFLACPQLVVRNMFWDLVPDFLAGHFLRVMF